MAAVATMGFRGEALAAINSIADCCIHSRAQGQAQAFSLDGHSGELSPVARSTGTTVEVKELFFSTPARRKFLKTDATELAHCLEAVRSDFASGVREGDVIEVIRIVAGG